MTLLNDLVSKYADTKLDSIFSSTATPGGVNLASISSDRYQQLKEVTLAQWLLESARATSQLANTAKNFAGLKWRKEMTGFATPLNILVPSEPVPMEFCQFAGVDEFITGYWRFLSRSPYIGLVEHTNTPENFLGFLQRQGFAADLDYVNKVIHLLPEAHNLLAQAMGIVVSPPPDNFKVVGFPKEVEVGQGFRIIGTAPIASQGQNLEILIDGIFKPPASRVGEDGKWLINFVFNQPGDRKMKLTLGNKSTDISIKVSPAVDGSDDPDTPNPTGAVSITLTGSVGRGSVNKASEVLAVKQRMRDLGYDWVGNSSAVTTGFIQAIQLFQSIIDGGQNIGGDGRVDVGGTTHRWLQAKNAPEWKLMPKSNPAINFVNRELNDTDDHHDFGASWLYDAILEIAQEYHRSSPNSAPFTINDVSLPHGGDTEDHHGHETGLMCDVYLPRTDGRSGDIDMDSSKFDRVLLALCSRRCISIHS
jgi:Mannosyl-glycoprotein endo-beta-N-acetylglucosaminidase